MSVFFTRAALLYIFTTFWGPHSLTLPPLFFFFPRVPRGCLPKTGGGVWKLAWKNSFPRFYNVSIGRTDGHSRLPRNREIQEKERAFFPLSKTMAFHADVRGPPFPPFPFSLFWRQNLPSLPPAHSRHFSSGRNHHIHPFSLQTGFPSAQALPPLSSTWVRNFSDPSARYSLPLAGRTGGDPF